MRSVRDDDAAMVAEWRRLRRAAVFFVGCVAIVAIVGAIGLYH